METTREQFDKLVKKYNEYVDLYKFFNNGSAEGITPFDIFYRRMTYYIKYENPSLIGTNNF